MKLPTMPSVRLPALPIDDKDRAALTMLGAGVGIVLFIVLALAAGLGLGVRVFLLASGL